MRSSLVLPLIAVGLLLAALPSSAAPVGVDPFGDAEGDVVAVSLTGNAKGGLLAATATGDANATSLCSADLPVSSVREYCPGAAVSGTGDASCHMEALQSFMDKPVCAAASGTGHAEADRLCEQAFGMLFCFPNTFSGGDL